MTALVRPENIVRQTMEFDASFEGRVDRQRRRIEGYMTSMPPDVRARIDAEQERAHVLDGEVIATREAIETAQRAVVNAKITGADPATVTKLETAWAKARRAAADTQARRELQDEVSRALVDQYLDDRHASEIAAAEGGIAEARAKYGPIYERAATHLRAAMVEFDQLATLVEQEATLAQRRARMETTATSPNDFMRLGRMPGFRIDSAAAAEAFLEAIAPPA